MDFNKLIKTADGSPTLFSDKFQATYHSTHGALTESQVVFIQSGLDFAFHHFKKPIRIFEMGFGTGFNAHLTYLWHQQKNIQIAYTGIEAFPVSEKIWLEYSQFLDEQERDVFNLWHLLTWNNTHVVSPLFSFQKIHNTVENHVSDHLVNLIYYDAFGPGTQPELWQEGMMKKMYDMLEIPGVLTTYCAQGEFKRTLKKIGFRVTSLPGPPGKREIVRAEKVD